MYHTPVGTVIHLGTVNIVSYGCIQFSIRIVSTGGYLISYVIGWVAVRGLKIGRYRTGTGTYGTY